MARAAQQHPDLADGDADPAGPRPTSTTRRTVLRGGAAAAAAIGIAACAHGGRAASPVPTHTGPVRLGPTSEVPVGGGKIYPSAGVVVTQPAAGQFKCFTSTCTHASCQVTEIVNGTITCPCHHSAFHIADGTVARGPATQALTAEPITVADGTITLS